MKKNKMLSLFASSAMIIGLVAMPIQVSAASNVAKIGTTEYASLGDAVKAANSNDVITIIDSGEITGTQFPSGKKLTIDLNGKVVSITKPMVGSAGTETNGFQILKDSDITFKNGTVKTTDTSNKILFQNYSNLTLQDVTLDASQSSMTGYVLSNNYGNVVVKGKTNILAYEGKTAFDVWYGLSPSYYDGVTVTFDQTFTGKVKGKIEYGAESKSFNQPNWTGKTKISISGNGTFDINIVDGNLADKSDIKDANITIDGGEFSSDVSHYVKTGYKLYDVSGAKKVAPVTTKVELDSSTLKLEVGKTASLKTTLTPATTLDTVSYTSNNTAIATVDATGKVTAIKEGTAVITAKAGDKSATCDVTVTKVPTPILPETPKPEVPTIDPTKPTDKVEVGIQDKASQEAINSTVNSVVDEILKGNSVSENTMSQATADALKQAVAENKVISSKVEAKTVEASSIEKKVINKVDELVEKFEKANSTNATVAQYLDLSVLLLADNSTLGTLNELDKPVEFTIAMPSTLKKDGRKFYVIRVHNDVAEKLATTLNEDGTLTFSTDKFSTYALVYEDAVVKQGTVQTSDNVYSAILVMLGIVTLLGGAYIYKKKEV